MSGGGPSVASEAERTTAPAANGGGILPLSPPVDRDATPTEDAPNRRVGRVAGVAVWIIVGLAIVVGIALRAWSLSHFPTTSDEAVAGLMAQQILHGHFSAFYWGQPYGGVEPYVTAPVFAIFGSSILDAPPGPRVVGGGRGGADVADRPSPGGRSGPGRPGRSDRLGGPEVRDADHHLRMGLQGSGDALWPPAHPGVPARRGRAPAALGFRRTRTRPRRRMVELTGDRVLRAARPPAGAAVPLGGQRAPENHSVDGQHPHRRAGCPVRGPALDLGQRALRPGVTRPQRHPPGAPFTRFRQPFASLLPVLLRTAAEPARH